MKEKLKYLQGTKQVLDQSAKEQEPYWVTILGKRFIVLPNVFSPKYFFDTEFFADSIKVVPGEEFLEIGPGSGIVSTCIALRHPKRVLALDINPDAVKNTKENARIHKVEDILTVRESDLYSALKPDDHFDTIFGTHRLVTLKMSKFLL